MISVNGNVCRPNIFDIVNNGDHKTNIEVTMMKARECISDALAKGNEIMMMCRNDQLLVYELEYAE